MIKITFLLLILTHSAFVFSQDTFSICAVDTLTGEVGSAGASCIDENSISGGCIILSDVKPGIGVIHSQAYWNPTNQNYASQLMDMGLPPQQIIDSLVAHDVQNNPHIRQYGIVDFIEGYPRMAAFTGVNCDDYKNHIIGPNYTIQGNILLGQQILDSMESRFLSTEGELACKLMAALQGAKVIGADTRCFDDGTSSLSAFLRVGQPGDPQNNLYLDLNVPSTPAGIDPIDSLQVLVDNWGGCFFSSINAVSIIPSRVYPNPAKDFLKITLAKYTPHNALLEIFNSVGGKIISRSDISNNPIQVKCDFKDGIYYYLLSENEEITAKGKFLISR
ncbi:MAG: DUF1028 domain-containing protein [Bacteroidales bacterium]|nr:DUF1028 domain-containing protein [Bacteroidales bacterium]